MSWRIWLDQFIMPTMIFCYNENCNSAISGKTNQLLQGVIFNQWNGKFTQKFSYFALPCTYQRQNFCYANDPLTTLEISPINCAPITCLWFFLYVVSQIFLKKDLDHILGNRKPKMNFYKFLLLLFYAFILFIKYSEKRDKT